MASLYVEYGNPALKTPYGSSLHGPCVFSEVLTISGTQADGTAATPAQTNNTDLVARLTTDTDCYIAIGATPDTTATAQTADTTARRFLGAGATIALTLTAGAKVGVKAVS
jgi:hypothetical protein